MSTTVTFTEMSGSGNDFMLIDNRQGAVPPELGPALAKTVCRRRVSVGADGLILIENDREVDFSGACSTLAAAWQRCAGRVPLSGAAPSAALPRG